MCSPWCPPQKWPCKMKKLRLTKIQSKRMKAIAKGKLFLVFQVVSVKTERSFRVQSPRYKGGHCKIKVSGSILNRVTH